MRLLAGLLVMAVFSAGGSQAQEAHQPVPEREHFFSAQSRFAVGSRRQRLLSALPELFDANTNSSHRVQGLEPDCVYIQPQDAQGSQGAQGAQGAQAQSALRMAFNSRLAGQSQGQGQGQALPQLQDQDPHALADVDLVDQPEHSRTLRCLPSWLILGVYKVRQDTSGQPDALMPTQVAQLSAISYHLTLVYGPPIFHEIHAVGFLITSVLFQCGTSDLFTRLTRHPDVNPGPAIRKEPAFFSAGLPTTEFPRGSRSYQRPSPCTGFSQTHLPTFLFPLSIPTTRTQFVEIYALFCWTCFCNCREPGQSEY